MPWAGGSHLTARAPLRTAFLQRRDGVTAIGVDGSDPLEALRVFLRKRGGPDIGSVEGAGLQLPLTCLVMEIVEGQQHQLRAFGKLILKQNQSL